MPVAKRKRDAHAAKPGKAELNGRQTSFRHLKAFGLWAHRADVTDPVQFTKRIRTRMEHGKDAQ
jgi:hypothetical protein